MASNFSEGARYPLRWWAFAALSFSLLVIALDNTILNVALPSLVRELGATASELQWIVDAYVLVFAGLLLTTGSLADRFGRKRALVLGLAIFAAGSVAAAFSPNPAWLIATRAFMGIGGAMIMPSTLSITTNIFPEKERGRAIGAWAGVVGLGVILGPITGGWLLEHFWWGSVFLINLPVIAVMIPAVLALVPESRDPSAPRLDPLGAALSILGLSALLYAIIEVPAHGWTAQHVLIAFGVAVALLLAFVVWEFRAPSPMLDMRLFRKPRFTAASLALTLTSFALFGALFFLTQYLQFVLALTALEAGIRLIPLALGLLVGAPLSARLAERFGAKAVVTTGMTVVAIGLASLSLATVDSGYERVAIMLVILGFGMGMAMAPATNAVMGALPLAKAGVGSAVNDTTRQIGGALGVAVLGSVLAGVYRGGVESRLAGLPPQVVSAAGDSVGKALAIAQTLPGGAGVALTAAARAAFVEGMTRTVLVAAGFALLGALVALLWLPAHARAAEPAPESEGELAVQSR